MKKILLLGAAWATLPGSAQTGIACDGVDDVMTVANASSHFLNDDISMSFWVYPTNPNPGFPDFDGFAGFRSESNFDFYILQLTATQVECRYRNNSGVVYDILFNGLLMNAWNHFVFTFNGTQTEVFHNGVSVGTTPVSGTITNGNVPFEVGKTQFGPPFWTTGKFDDAALWSRALTASEVASLYNSCSVDLSSPDLVLCYEFEDGQPGQSNTGVTVAIDSKGTQNGVYSGFAMTGTASNFINGNGPIYSADTVTACFSFTTQGGQTYTQSGFYTDSLQSVTGCDSILSLDLTINSIDLTVTQTGDTLSANQSGALIYQWINCDSGQLLSTDQQFTATQNGNYACIITYNGCQDTSDCITVSGIDLNEGLTARWALAPNPAQSSSMLHFATVQEQIEIRIVDVHGRIVREKRASHTQKVLLPNVSRPGLYFVKVHTEKGQKVFRWVVR